MQLHATLNGLFIQTIGQICLHSIMHSQLAHFKYHFPECAITMSVKSSSLFKILGRLVDGDLM